jgi:L-lactate dehydrogenase complex protein LldG
VTSAREEVLARLRAARDAGGATAPEVPRAYRRTGTLAPGSRAAVDRVDETLTDYRATVHRVRTEDEVPDAIDAVLAGAGAAVVVVPPGLAPAWRDGCAGSGRTVRVDDPPLSVADLDRTDAVVTGAAVAIADTGTFVLDALAPDQGRRAARTRGGRVRG